MEEGQGEEGIGSKTLRIVTFNVQRWVDVKSKDNIARVIETLKRLNPDIVGLQEVMYPHPISSKASGILEAHRGKPALEVVAEALEMAFIYGKEIWDGRRLTQDIRFMLTNYF